MIRYESDSLNLGKLLETLPGKRENRQKRVKRENLPFLPHCMGRSRAEASLAPPRAAEREELSGKPRGRGFNSGEAPKKCYSRDSDPGPRATGPKVLPFGPENRRS